MEELKEIMSTCKDFFFAGLKAANSAKNEDDNDKDKDVKNEDVDKRKLIDEVAGMMKSAGCDDEVIRTAIGKMEKIGYDKSEAGKADNKAKNEDEDEKDKDEKKKDDKAENKCKNEDKEEDYEEFKEKVKEEAENCKAKNSLDDMTKAFLSGGERQKSKIFMTQKEGIELGKKLY